MATTYFNLFGELQIQMSIFFFNVVKELWNNETRYRKVLKLFFCILSSCRALWPGFKESFAVKHSSPKIVKDFSDEYGVESTIFSQNISFQKKKAKGFFCLFGLFFNENYVYAYKHVWTILKASEIIFKIFQSILAYSSTWLIFNCLINFSNQFISHIVGQYWRGSLNATWTSTQSLYTPSTFFPLLDVSWDLEFFCVCVFFLSFKYAL